jgi:signal transduction histidine kinase
LRKLVDLEQKPIEQAPVDVASLLQETFDITKEIHQHEDREFMLTLPRVPWPLPTVRGDRDLLQLAFHNLLDNAVKFSHEKDSIELRAFEDGNTATIEVADSGRGIPSTDLPHIWEELYRGELAHGIPGSGLGLALTKAIIERHGGVISARSRMDKGTVISVSLPLM